MKSGAGHWGTRQEVWFSGGMCPQQHPPWQLLPPTYAHTSSPGSSRSRLPGHIQHTGPSRWQSTHSHTGEGSGDPSIPWMLHIPPQHHTVPVPVLGLARLPLRLEQYGL